MDFLFDNPTFLPMSSFPKLTTSIIFLFFLLMINTAGANEVHHRVQVDLQGKDIKDFAALGVALDIAEYRPGVSLMGEFSETELRLMKDAGFHYTILIEDMTRYYQARNEGYNIDELNLLLGTTDNGTPYATPENFTLGSMGGFHTWSEALADLDQMRAMFPELISEKQPISSMNTIEGRPVHWVRISNNPDVEQDKPKVLYTALTHAREPASLQQMLFQMWYLLENYETDPEIQYLIDNMEMYFVPVVNPDGYVYCETTHPNGGSMHRKNMRINSNNSIGVDLNRNFGYMWGYDNVGSSPNPSAQTFRGTAPFSEPETQLQKEFAETYDFILALNNHTFSDLLIYPWGFNGLATPDNDIFQAYAAYMTRENGYVYGTCYETLGYFANGVSDDWFYGEQTTKDKVFAFTPEAGAPSDGFWPAVHRIEEICAGHTHMNLGLARLALIFAEVTDLTDKYIAERNTEIEFEIINLGQGTPANFTVSLLPITNNILATGDPVSFSNMEILHTETASIHLELQPFMNTGEEITFVLSLDNGGFAWNDTITKYYGQPQVVFFDPCDNLDNWDTESWGICTQLYYSEPSSIADSPGGNYENNAYKTITIAEPFDLSNASIAWVEFMTRFAIETNWDYVQFMYSTDNQQTWTALAGEYTSTGGNNQDPGQPLYHGSQTSWVQEIVDLSHLTGEEEVYFKFRLVSDHIINAQGFYFDDFTLMALSHDVSYHFFPPGEISYYQHEETIVDFSDYVNWSLSGNVSLEWANNEMIDISSVNETTVSITSSDIFWTGGENILFTISDDLAELDQEVLITSEPVPAPEITGQEETGINPGQSLTFDPMFIHVQDEHFDYPEDFTITLHDGDHYSISGGHTIVPDETFTGWLTIPVLVNNGFHDSNIFDFQVQVDDALHLPDHVQENILVYYHRRSHAVILDFSKITEPLDQVYFTLYDMHGRAVVPAQEIMTREQVSVPLTGIDGGIYIVQLSGNIRLHQKISIY